jgi:MFS family permease
MSMSVSPEASLPAENGRGRRGPKPDEAKASAVLSNRPFLLLWLSQLATQVGGNMVMYALTISITNTYKSSSAVSVLLVCFLVPAIIFSALAGVFVDRADKRHILLITNIIRGAAVLAIALFGSNLLLIYVLMAFIATVTTFFAPAEASMIPLLVPKNQLVSANGLFTLTMNVAFVLGFAMLGPIVVAIANTQVLIVIVAALYLMAAVFCWTLPPAPRAQAMESSAVQTVADAERAVSTMFSQFFEGIAYIRSNRSIGWSLSYLGFAGALVGILAVVGSNFATKTLGLGEKDFALIVLPMGLGIMMGILILNSYGRYLPRRRTIEAGMICIGILLSVLAWSGPISRFLQEKATSTGVEEASRVVSLLSMVMGLAFFIGAAYAIVAISAQTQLQEELPEDVRGRVFGILNMLVSIASLAPLIIVGPVSDIVGREPVIFAVGIIVGLWGLASVFSPGSRASDNSARAPSTPSGAPVDLLTVAISPTDLSTEAGPDGESL